MAVNENNEIVSALLKTQRTTRAARKPGRCLASMGIYIFTADVISDKLLNDAADPESSHDFGKDIIPSMIGKYPMLAHPFQRSCIKIQPIPTSPTGVTSEPSMPIGKPT